MDLTRVVVELQGYYFPPAPHQQPYPTAPLVGFRGFDYHRLALIQRSLIPAIAVRSQLPTTGTSHVAFPIVASQDRIDRWLDGARRHDNFCPTSLINNGSGPRYGEVRFQHDQQVSYQPKAVG